MIVIKDVLIL